MSLPSEATIALIQLLSALISTNNETRSAAEDALNKDWIAGRPALLLLGLAEQVQGARDVALRSFSAVLLRRIAPKDAPTLPGSENEDTVWDRAGIEAQVQVKSFLLSAFETEENSSVRHKLSDLIAEITQFDEGWPQVQSALLQCTQAPLAGFRESAFRVFSTNPDILGTSYSDQLRSTFMTGLEDGDQSVRLAAVQAFSIYLITVGEETRSRFETVVPALMNVLPPLLQAQDSEGLTFALNALSELVEAYPKIFKSMFASMVNFCIAVIRNKELENAARQASLETLVVFAEGAPGMCRKSPNYTNDLVVECLALMTDLGDDDDVAGWLATEDLDEDESDANHVAGEQALDRLARKLGGKTLLPPAFQWLPKLMASENWQERHAALMALSSIAEGCEKIMRQELGKVLAMVLPSLSDVHPRVRWAGCNAIGQMCTDFAGDVQEKFTQEVLNALTPALDSPEARVAAHAAAAFVNFCEVSEQVNIEPYLDPVLERLLGLLQRPQKYVQEQAVTTIATVADAAEKKFIKYYETIMPLLLNVLRDASSEEYRLLRGKAMECATLVALAVGKDVFASHAPELIRLLGGIQNSMLSSDDPQSSYLMASWGRLCKVLGSDFQPYLNAVMPPILTAAKLKPDFTVIRDESEKEGFSEEDGWEFFPLRGQQVGIKTSTLEDKNSAVSILVLYAQEMKAQFQPYVEEVMKDIALPGLVFYYHDGVRSASARLLPELLNCIKLSSNNAEVLMKSWNLIVNKLLDLMKSEPSVEMLTEIYQAFYECMEVLGAEGIGPAHMEAVITSTESQLNDYSRRATARAADHKAGDVDLEQDEDVLYEIELDEELLSEISKTFHVLFKHHRSGFVPYWKRLLPYLQNFSNSSEANCRQWSICVYDDLIEFCGSDAWDLRDQFMRPLAAGLQDASPEVRQAAAYGIGCAAQHGGEVFSNLVAQSIPSLFALIGQPESRMEDNIYATENACVSIAKICRFNSAQVEAIDDVIAAWLKTMPVTHDEQDAPYAYRYLGELMDRSVMLIPEKLPGSNVLIQCSKHPAIMADLFLTIDIIAQAVENAVITGQNLKNLIESTKTLLTGLPAHIPEQLVSSLEVNRREAFTKQFQ